MQQQCEADIVRQFLAGDTTDVIIGEVMYRYSMLPYDAYTLVQRVLHTHMQALAAYKTQRLAKLAEASRKWRAEHPTANAETVARWRDRHPEKVREYERISRERKKAKKAAPPIDT